MLLYYIFVIRVYTVYYYNKNFQTQSQAQSLVGRRFKEQSASVINLNEAMQELSRHPSAARRAKCVTRL